MGDLCSHCGSPEHEAEDCDARVPVDHWHEAYKNLREAVLLYLDGAPLNEHSRFVDARREALYRAAQRDE